MIKIDKRKIAGLRRTIEGMPDQIDLNIRANKKHAEGIRKFIINSILKGQDIKPRLKPATIAIKQKNGMDYPYQPLAGKAKDDKRSMINLLVLVEKTNSKGKTSYEVRPQGKHHSGLPAKVIWAIHEYGANIANGFGKGINIRIPARYPIRNGVRRYNKSNERSKLMDALKRMVIDAFNQEVSKVAKSRN